MDERDLLETLLDIERHVEADGWDQPTLLFALVPTEHLRRTEPGLAEQLGVHGDGPPLTTFEQGATPADRPLDAFLAGIEWPPSVEGAVVAMERIVLPPDAEEEVAASPEAIRAARERPDARDMRIVVGVLRSGVRMCALRARGHDDESVLTGADLVPDLADALLGTFR